MGPSARFNRAATVRRGAVAGFIALALAVAAAGRVQAQGALAPNYSGFPVPGITAAMNPNLDCTVVQDKIIPYKVPDFSFSLVSPLQLSGTLEDRVCRENTSGTLDFYLRLANDAFSTTGYSEYSPLSLVAGGSFGNFSTAVGWRQDGPGVVAPTTATRSADGNAVSFTFLPIIGPGVPSRFVLIQTNATQFDDLGSTAVVPAFGGYPVLLRTAEPAVPEPGSLALLATGFLPGLLALKKRRLC